MKLIVKDKNIKNADGFLFGLKGFSVLDKLVDIEDLSSFQVDKVFISIDKNIFNDELSLLEDKLISLDKLGVAGVFFYDISILSIVKRLNLNIKLIWNQNYFVSNYKTCNFYKDEGVSGAVVASEITISEIEEIAKNTSLSLFVNIFGYSMMAVSRRKLVSSYFDFIDEVNDKEINYMMERGKSYPVIEKEYGTKFLSDKVLCGIRYINRLKNAGIEYLIIDNFLISDDIFEKVFNIFSKALSVSDEELLDLEGEINSILPCALGFFDKKTIYKVKRK